MVDYPLWVWVAKKYWRERAGRESIGTRMGCELDEGWRMKVLRTGWRWLWLCWRRRLLLLMGRGLLAVRRHRDGI